MHARLSKWAKVSDVALLKRLRSSEEWLRTLCLELLRENFTYRIDQSISPTIRIVHGTIVKEPGKTGSQWRVLYSIRLPTLMCDFFEVTATIGDGTGESLNRLPVKPHELIVADAGYCSVAGIECIHQRGADVLVRLTLRASLRIPRMADASLSFPDYELCHEWDNPPNGRLSCVVRM